MSAIPEVNYQAVSQKLTAKLADALLQISALEDLAEQLRTQRDEYSNRLAAANTET